MDNTFLLISRVIEELSREGAPITIRGAIVLKHIIYMNNLQNLDRYTQNLNLSWNKNTINIGELIQLLRSAVETVDNTLQIAPYEKLKTSKTKRIHVIDTTKTQNRNKVFSIGINPECIPFNTIYQTTINRIPFAGETPEKMLANKIAELSSAGDKRNIKNIYNIYDIYVLSAIPGYKSSNIIKIVSQSNNSIGSFGQFMVKKERLEQEYLKFDVALNKPGFSDIYYRVYRFMYPFITKNYRSHEYTWNGNSWA